MTPTETQIARAERIAEQSRNAFEAALAAIMETQEACAKVADKHRLARYAARDNANQRKETREARDHESMAIEAGHIAAAIRAGEQP